MKFTDREALWGPVVRQAFEKEGLPGYWGMAIAAHESRFDPQAQALAGGDGRRGGSFGLCQVSLKTAAGEFGYTGDGEGLKDPVLNAQFAARLCKILTHRVGNDLKDIASAYNSGRPYADAPQSTREIYVPRVLAFAKKYQGATHDGRSQ